MKKFFVYSFAVLFILIFASSCKTNKKEQKSAPQKTATDTAKSVQEYFFPEEFVYNQSVDQVLTDKFYPIGWSKDGKFAYFVEPADEAAGFYMLDLVVKDMINNEIVWKWETPPDDEAPANLEDAWHKYYDLFKRKLNNYGIIQQKNFDLKPTYFSFKGKDYILDLQTNYKRYEGFGIDVLDFYRVIIKSPQLGEKIVGEERFEEYNVILNCTLKGAFISPYEPRIAVLLSFERRGYEGPPNVIEFNLLGTNLETSFKK